MQKCLLCPFGYSEHPVWSPPKFKGRRRARNLCAPSRSVKLISIAILNTYSQFHGIINLCHLQSYDIIFEGIVFVDALLEGAKVPGPNAPLLVD